MSRIKGNTKLTKEQIVDVYDDHYKGGMSYSKLAKFYGVSAGTIFNYLQIEKERRNTERKRYPNGRLVPRSRGVVKVKLKPCGTMAAYRRHKRNGEQACIPCCDANAEYSRMQRTKRK